MRRQLSYAQEFIENCGSHLVYRRTIDIIDDMESSNTLGISSRVNSVAFIIVDKIVMKHQKVLLLLMYLSRDAPAAKSLGITHFDGRSFYISPAGHMFRIFQGRDSLVKNYHKPSSFYRMPSTAKQEQSSLDFTVVTGIKAMNDLQFSRCFWNP